MLYYVDNSLSSNGNGTSWSSAWNSLGAINWSAIHPGDTIEISGGSSGQTYNEELDVNASGSAAGQVTIQAATDPGHNGPVTIDGNNTRDGVSVNGQNYVTVQGLKIQNIGDAGVSVKNSSAGVVIQNNSVYSGDPGGGNARGYDIRNSTGTQVLYNSYSTPTSTSAQTDGIYSSGNTNAAFEHNNIVIKNSNTNGHSDGFQSYQDYNVTVQNNLLEQNNSASVNNHGAWISDAQSGATIQFNNNEVLAPNLTADSAVTYWNESNWNGNGTANFSDNTIIGGKRGVNIDGSNAVQVKNNVVEPAAGGYGAFVANATPSAGNINNNLIWAPNASIANVNGKTVDWSGWQALGYDQNGVNANPDFVDPSNTNYALASGSPAGDRGATIGSVGIQATGTQSTGSQPSTPQATGAQSTGTQSPSTGSQTAGAPSTGTLAGSGSPSTDSQTVGAPSAGTQAGSGSQSTDSQTVGAPSAGTQAGSGSQSTDSQTAGAPSTGTQAGSSPSTDTQNVVGPSKLTLALSEDRCHGNAKFIAKVDGQTLNGPTSVTAQHDLNQAQTFTFSGNWSSGPHDVEIDFLNDKYKSAGHDRNLYVNSVQYNGVGSLNGSVPMHTNGVFHVTVGSH